jgi:hypothetical protein
MTCIISLSAFSVDDPPSMKGLEAAARPGRELFRCRPKPLRDYFALRYQGELPGFASARFLNSIIATISPFIQNLLLAGLPTIGVIFVLQVVLGLKPPHEPGWVRPACFAVLALSVPTSIWWCWFAPRRDVVIVSENGFRWRISLCRVEWFGSRGTFRFTELKGLSYRSDSFDAEPRDCGKTTSEKLARLLLEASLSRHDIRFELKDGREVVAERFFARFEEKDLRRFLQHLGSLAEEHRIEV